MSIGGEVDIDMTTEMDCNTLAYASLGQRKKKKTVKEI